MLIQNWISLKYFFFNLGSDWTLSQERQFIGGEGFKLPEDFHEPFVIIIRNLFSYLCITPTLLLRNFPDRIDWQMLMLQYKYGCIK